MDRDPRVSCQDDAHASTAAPSPVIIPQRDVRIDFLRGLALIVIFIDHTTETYRAAGGHAYYLPTLRDFGLCSAAEFFFFLSGYVFAIAHGRIMDRSGVQSSHRKAIQRAAQIYAANVLIFSAVAFIVMPLSSRPDDYMHFSGLWLLRDQPQQAIWRFLTLRYLPAYTDILPLYIIFVVLAPFVLLALRRLAVLTLVISLSIYVAANWLPWLGFPLTANLDEQWGLNPFSWQLLFVAGLAFGTRTRRAEVSSSAQSRFERTSAWCALTLLFAIAVARGIAGAAKLLGNGDWSALQRAFALPGLGMTHAGPVRLGYFAMLLFVVFRLMPPSPWFERRRWSWPITACGSRSLTIFAASTALAQFVALTMLRLVHGYVVFLTFIAGSIIAVLCLGVLLRRRPT